MPTRFKSWLLPSIMIGLLAIGLDTTGSASRGDLVNPVNMSIEGNRLFVSDPQTGVHIYDVTDPHAPFATMVIPLTYNRGTAIKDDILYANSAGAILAIRVTDDSYEVVSTIKSDPVYVDGVPGFGPVRHDGGFGCACARREQPVVAPQGSTGSSYATFAVIGDYLYYVDHSSLVTMDISVADKPRIVSQTGIGWDVETLYPTETYLFIGGTRGMYIYDRTKPQSPKMIGIIQHFRACDPVVVSGSTAYVTLRGGNRCGENRDVLLCVDISDPSAPTVVREKSLPTPYGMAIDQSLLYVSTGPNGFQLFDVQNPKEPQPISSWSERPTKDFIWSEDLLYTMGFDGILIYDVSSPESPVLLSEIGSQSGAVTRLGP